MKKGEFIEAINRIGALEDVAQMRTELATLRDSVSADYDTHATVTAERDQYISDNESLRQANMKLFLQVGTNTPSSEPKKAQEPKTDLKYENLFNEKGDLK